MGGAEIRISDPVVSFRETVNQMSDHIVMSKSPNKHNRCVSATLPLEHKGLALLQLSSCKFSSQDIILQLLSPGVLTVELLPALLVLHVIPLLAVCKSLQPAVLCWPYVWSAGV